MKSKRIISLGIFAALVAGFSLSTIAASYNSGFKAAEAYYPNTNVNTYYAGIDLTKTTGDNLLSSLRTLNSNKRRTLVGYEAMTSYFSLTDPGTRSGTVMAYYSGTSARYNGNMNREHVWPFSKLVINEGERGQNAIEDDIHMIRPAMIDENTGRGNSFFTEPTGAGWDPGSLGDVTYRGDAARIIFYCVVADSGLSLVDRDYDSKDNHTMGKLSTLLKWNLKYTVTSREKTRNEAAERLQGNRNPFIDHPEYACHVWGKYNAETEKICANYFKEPEISIDYSSLTLSIDSSFQLTATITPAEYPDRTVLWESDNPPVAVVSSSGLVTTLASGEATITAYTSDRSKSMSCVIKVIGGSQPTPVTPKNNTNICGGGILTTSVVLSSISLLGAGLLLIKKRRDR